MFNSEPLSRSGIEAFNRRGFDETFTNGSEIPQQTQQQNVQKKHNKIKSDV